MIGTTVIIHGMLILFYYFILIKILESYLLLLPFQRILHVLPVTLIPSH